MNRFLKKAIFFFLLLQLFVPVYSEQNGLPSGLTVIRTITPSNAGKGESEVELNLKNLLKYEAPEFEQWMKAAGIEPDKYGLVLERTFDVIKQAWKDAMWDLTHCPTFINHKNPFTGESTKDIFDKNIKNGAEAPLLFTFDPYVDYAGDDPFGNILFKTLVLQQIMTYAANKVKQGTSDITDYKSNPDLQEFYSFLAHEMLHEFGGLGTYDVYSDTQKIFECEIYCLQKWCMDDGKDNHVPSYCNSLCKEGYCKEKYEPCKCKITANRNSGSSRTSSSSNGSECKPDDDRPNDFPDDNFSNFTGLPGYLGSPGLSYPSLSGGNNYNYYYSYYPDILVYHKYDMEEIHNLLNLFADENYIDDYEHTEFLDRHKILIVPSGELTGEQDSELIKVAFQRFVEAGNTLIVLGQQYGKDFSNLIPVPEDSSVQAYGWREDQSCYWGSSYFQDMRPVLSGITTERVSIGVDGYFSIYPSGATVVLRRISNQEPALLYYQYGAGTVILTSMYTDWGYAHSQVSADELRLVRDLITFAKNPNRPIPMFDLAPIDSGANPRPNLNLTINMRNNTEVPATRAKIRVFTPDRNRLLSEYDTDITIAPGEEGNSVISFTLPEFQREEYGICHTDYELYDADNNIIQESLESAGGRFAVYKIIVPYQPEKKVVAWLTAEEEEVYPGERPEVTLHVKNNTDEVKTIAFSSGNAAHPGPWLFDITLQPGEATAKTFSHALLFERVWINSAETGAICKGFSVIRPKAQSTVQYLGVHDKKPGEPLEYEISLFNPNKKDTVYKVNLRISPYYASTGSAQVLSQDVTVKAGETIKIRETIPADKTQNNGLYILRMSITGPDGYTRYEDSNHMKFIRSEMEISGIEIVESVPDPLSGRSYLEPGKTYTARFKIKNPMMYSIANGHVSYYLLYGASPVESGDVGNLQFEPGEEKEITGTLVFNPTSMGNYSLSTAYSDETRAGGVYQHKSRNGYYYSIDATLTPDKTHYFFGETARVAGGIKGVGRYKIEFKSAAGGINEIREVEIPADTLTWGEEFLIPINRPGLKQIDLSLKVTDSSGRYKELKNRVGVEPVNVDMTIQPGELTARVGEPVLLSIDVKALSGLLGAQAGDLKVSSPDLKFEETRAITIDPVTPGRFDFSIPIDAAITSGTYTLYSGLDVGGYTLKSLSYQINIPAPDMKFTTPPATITAGTPLSLIFENPGGKNGSYNIHVLLKDENAKTTAEYTGSHDIAAGNRYTIDIPVPGYIESGKYILSQHAQETLSVKNFDLYTGVQVNGVTASLNSYTLKSKYFDNELVTGKSEITSGNVGIENGELAARIKKLALTPGIEVIKPIFPSKYSAVVSGIAENGKLRLATNSYGNDQIPATHLIEYDTQAKKITEILDAGKISSPGNPIWRINRFQPGISGGNWLIFGCSVTGDGVWFLDDAGALTHYTVDNGLLSNNANDILVQSEGNEGAVWVGMDLGVSLLKNGAWTSYTTANGLPSGFIYKFAHDAEGRIWVSTEGGVVRFNGVSFEGVNAPFGNAPVNELMTNTASGAVWIAVANKIHRCQSGSWTSWDYADIPTPVQDIWEINSSGDEVWFRGGTGGDYLPMVMKYDSSFKVYSLSDIAGIINISCLIKGDGNGAWFGIGDGYMTLVDEAWKQHYFIPLNGLLSRPTCTAEDRAGNVWAGTRQGVSKYDNNAWTAYVESDTGEPIGNIDSLAPGGNGVAYGYNSEAYYDVQAKYFWMMQGSAVNKIPLPPDGKYIQGIAADALGRLWVSHEWCGEGCYKLSYYDGSWHSFIDTWQDTVMVPDNNGGLWVAGLDYSVYEYKLTHIGSNLSVREFTPNDSGLLSSKIITMREDSKGVLWIIYNNPYIPPTVATLREGYQDHDLNILQSFDGVDWIDYSETPGYKKPAALAEDNTGRLVIMGINDDSSAGLYRLENGMFIDMGVTFFPDEPKTLVSAAGNFYTRGSIGNSGESGLLKISGSNASAKEVWSAAYPVTISAGNSLNIDMDTARTLEPGNYILDTKLRNSIGQELGSVDYPFDVIGSAVSVNVKRSGAGSLYVRPGTNIAVDVETLNNTAENKPGLGLTIKKISPSGVEAILQSETITLGAGQSAARSFTFDETELGVWKIDAEIRAGSTLLSMGQSTLEITRPEVVYELIKPGVAGDDPFEIKIKLSNRGKIDAAIHAAIGDSPAIIAEDVTLKPGEERLVSGVDVITADKAYDMTISGDLEATEPFTVRYGYVENFVPQVLPAYREGEVSIEFTISNTGELPLKDAVHFELFQLGNPTPLYTADKTYNLYPGEQAITDALGFSLAPGSYELQYKTGKGVPRSVPVNVLPSGIGQFSITPEIKYPAGQVQIPYTLQNIDAGQGEFTLVYRLFIDPSAPVSSGTLNQWVDAGQSLSDSIILAVPQPGNYTLAVTCVKIPGGEQITPVRVLPVKQTTAVVEAQPVANGVLPVTVRIENTGHEVFSGTLIVEADGQRYEEPLTVDSDRVFQTDSRLDTGNFSPGDREVKARIIDAEGNTMSESVRVVTVKAADIVFVSANNGNPIEIGPGGYADAAVKLRNNGDRSGEASIRFRAFDTLDDTRQVLLTPGEEIQLTGIYIDAYGDIPEGNYPCRYTLTGPGVTGGFSEGNIPFHVSGLKTDVSAALDRQSYQPGESALLTIDVSSPDVISTPIPLEAVVNWGNFSETRTFSLTSGGPASLAFNLPIPDQYVPIGKIFYGIYRERGRGIHLNDIYIRVNSAGVSIIPDKQVYMPDEIIHALVESEQSGTLTAEIFDQTETITINGSGSLQFAIPADTPGGTYSIRWSLTPGDPQGEMKSGGAPLDVSGLVVKVAKSELEKGKYAPGEIVKAALQLESNQDAGISLLSWSVTPSEVWEYWGRQELSVTGAVQSAAHIEHSLNTTEAGTHRLVYGLYQGDVLIASGSISFDCGDAVLLGLSTDKSEYKNGNENVKTRVDYFGQGNAQLELYLDNEKANDQGLTLSGVGSVEITLNSGGLTGGAHNLKALLTKDGLTSTKTTGFIYGSNLPDLSINLEETSNDGLNYTYKLRVVNSGKTASAASTLSFTDNGSVVETKSVSGLAAGQSEEVVIDWSGSGKAGAHTLVFTVDPGNAVKEFSETNNKLEITREVPALVYTLEAQPQVLAANTTATFITRLINNQPAALALSLEMALTNNETGQEIFQRTKTEELPALGSKTISDNFNAGIYPAGEYTLRQVITGGDIDMAQETWIVISPTKAMTANLAVTPLTVPSGVETDIRLTMQLKNTGNIALENEPLIIEVYHNEGNDVVKTEETQVTLALSEEKTVTRGILVNLVEGSYEIRLKYDEEEIANVVIKAAAAVESEKVVHIKPRVLVMNFNLALFNRAQPDFVYAVLNAGRVEYDTGQGIIESYVKWHKNYANMNIVFTGMLGRNIRAELKERVWRGEGLIVVCDNPIQSPDMEEFLGVRIKPVGGNSGETSIRLLPGELTAGGDAELMVKNRLAFTGIGSDVKVAAETARKKEPVMVYRKFGNGDILVICVPLQFKSGAGVVSQLILNAVTRFSRDVYTQSPLTRVLPIAITLNNQSDREIQLTVKELLPYGVEGYDYTPNPEPGEELKWNIAIPDAAKKSIDYWLKLPDKINSYDVKTEIYEGESKLEDVSLSLEVSQTVMSQITELVVELGAVEAAGRDAQNIRKAITSLEALRGRTGEGIPEHLRNLWDSTRAAGYIGSVKDVDVSGLRIKAQEIMIAVGRRFYEKVTAEGTSSSVLNSLTQMINGD